jgi:hypothetical protein
VTTKTQAVVDRFLVQYYIWAQEETRRELIADFPRVRRVNGTLAQKYVRFIATLKPSVAFVAASALVKRYHKRALELMGESLSEQDHLWIERFLTFEEPFTPTWNPAIADKNYRNVIESLEQHPHFDKTKLAGELRRRLRGVFGSDGDNTINRQGRRYLTERGPLVLNTDIDWGGRLPLRYSHTLFIANAQRVTHDISLLSWLGVCSDTSWNWVANTDISSAAELVAELCAYFRRAFLEFDLKSGSL